MNRIGKIILLSAGLSAALAFSAFAEDTTEAAAVEAAASAIYDMNWNDFAVSIDGEIWQFPQMYSDVDLSDWEAEDDLTQTLEPNQYGMFYFKQGERRMYIYIANFAQNTLPAQECVVCGISFDNFYWDITDGEIILPGGIVRGQATLEDIQNTYGVPSDTYEGDMYTKLTYETDIWETLELTVYNESGVLEEIDLEYLTAPEDFDAGEVSEEVPAEVAAYEKPEALSDDLTAAQIRIEDQVYELPVPVSTLIADGWTINASNTSESIPAKSSAWVDLMLGGQSMHILAANFSDNAVLPENGWITEISVGRQDIDLDGELAGGITVGMSREDLEALLETSGIEYEVEESDDSDFVYYTYDEKAYNDRKEVVLFKGEDGPYEANAVLTISVSRSDLAE